MASNTRPFRPHWASPPGDTIAEALKHRGLSRAEFARETKQSVEGAEALLEGRAPITLALARDLHRLIGGSVEFWMQRDFQYREDDARIQDENRAWLRDLPIDELVRFGWVDVGPPASDQLHALLRFFGVGSAHAWRRTYAGLVGSAAFRTSPSFSSAPGALAAWLRKGETEAEKISCASWDASGFRESLASVRPLTKLRDPDRFLPKLRAICASNGVAVIVLRAPTGCRASGATRFLSPEKGLIQLSFRYLSDDQFWFTFFHEAAHVLLDEVRLREENSAILEGTGEDRSAGEVAASQLAEQILFPGDLRDALRTLPGTANSVIRFAVRAGVSPGIVVGQLQHRRGRFGQLNSLKRRYVWSD